MPPGRYRVTPRNRQHLVLDGLHDMMISAEGVEIICTETTRAVTVKHCSGMVLRGLTIDYDPLPFTQGRITGLSADKKIHDVTLAEVTRQPAWHARSNTKSSVLTAARCVAMIAIRTA